MTDAFQAYLQKLRETPLDQHTEFTGRAALEALLNAFAAGAPVHGIGVQHETKRVAGAGAHVLFLFS